MDNGGLNDKFGGLNINNNNNNDGGVGGSEDNSLMKVFQAVEAAESIIRQQEEENKRLKTELLKRDQELEHLKVDKFVAQRYHSIDASDEHRQGVDGGRQTTSKPDSLGSLIIHQTLAPTAFFPAEGHSGDSRSNGNFNTLIAGQTAGNGSSSQILSPPSYSPGRYPKYGDYGPHINVSAQGFTPYAETNNDGNLWKQIREREEEIVHLKKHLAEFSVKEAQIRDEKYVLEKRIAHLRMAFDQQQQDVVDAASKALSYRQGVIEENVRLTYALQEAQQERTTFVSSLLPLLAEYSLQLQVSDAQSIVSNVKVLFKHLQEKLIITEAKLKESQYQLTPWRSYGTSPNFVAQSPEHSSGAANKIGLELVPRASYSPANGANLVNSSGHRATDWESRGQHGTQVGATSSSAQNSELINMGRFSPLASRDSDIRDSPGQVASSHDELHLRHDRQVKFSDPPTSSEVYAPDLEGNHNEREQSGTWVSGASPYSNTFDDPSPSYSPYLQPVPEEPSSSFSEAADDDPLPAIEDLQIAGEPYPGRQLQACGFSVNGTTSCNFEWVRHLEDGSVKYIDGAKQPIYLVTADDVETYLAIEVQPLDDRKRKGELVKVFANEHNKITCDPAMQSHVEQNFFNGHASYQVSLSTNYLDIWEPATLTIKREGFSIKGSADSGITVSEKFSPGTTVSITHGHDFEFSMFGTNGSEHLLRANDTIQDIVSVRDAIVLTLRLFIMKVLQTSLHAGSRLEEMEGANRQLEEEKAVLSKKLKASEEKTRQSVELASKANDQLSRMQDINRNFSDQLTAQEAKVAVLKENFTELSGYYTWLAKIECIEAYNQGEHVDWDAAAERAQFEEFYPNKPSTGFSDAEDGDGMEVDAVAQADAGTGTEEGTLLAEEEAVPPAVVQPPQEAELLGSVDAQASLPEGVPVPAAGDDI